MVEARNSEKSNHLRCNNSKEFFNSAKLPLSFADLKKESPVIYGEGCVQVCKGINKMDLKGQHQCERVFLGIMWTTTILAAILTFILDEVFAMFVTFTAGLALCAVICLPEWRIFNRNPLRFASDPKEASKDS